MMDSPRANSCKCGEFEIEKVPVHEVEIKSKELLPVFDHFHSIKSGWNDRLSPFQSYLLQLLLPILTLACDVDICLCLKFLVIIDSDLVKYFILADDSWKMPLKWVDIAEFVWKFLILIES